MCHVFRRNGRESHWLPPVFLRSAAFPARESSHSWPPVHSLLCFKSTASILSAATR